MRTRRNSALRDAAIALGVTLVTVSVSGVATAAGPEGTSKHLDKCDSCEAGAVWESFVEHLRATGRQDLIPPEAQTREEPAPEGEAPLPKPKIDLQGTDPIRGILFRMSNDLVNLDAIFQEAQGKPLDEAARQKARKLADRIRSSDDPFLRAYGDLHAARLDVEDGKHAEAVKALDGLVKSCYFLPKREARRHLASAYRGTGDDTLAILEIQFLLVDLPPENEVDRAWAREELRRIREKDHEGPLHDSKDNMKSISTLVAGLDVGEGTQGKARRVEDVVDKVAKLLERLGGT